MNHNYNDCPLVSVIIITYNQESFIAEAIESCLSQSFSDYEVLVCDDGSTDSTANIITFYSKKDSRIIPILGGDNMGISENANRGLRKAKGKYIAWLGGDDLMSPEKLKMQVSLLERNFNAVGCVHDAEVFQSETGSSLGNFSMWANGYQGLLNGDVRLWFMPGYKMLPSTVMFRADCAPKNGFDRRLKYTNDWLFDVEVFQNGKVLAINQVLGKYRRHESNVTSSNSLREIAVEDNLLAVSIVEARYPWLASLTCKKRQVIFMGACKHFWRIDRDKSIAYLRLAFHSGSLMSIFYIVFNWLFIRIRKVK